MEDIKDKSSEMESAQTESQEKAQEKAVKKKTSGAKKGSDGKLKKELEETQEKLAELQDKYLRMSAEYDNYRKRTLKEKMELTKTGGERVLLNILPVLDNLDRAMTSVQKATDVDAVKVGLELIIGKFLEFMDQNGVKEIPAMQADFDTDLHEAITKIPTDQEDMKGKIVDVIEKGYFLHEKVLRYAKVVVGE